MKAGSMRRTRRAAQGVPLVSALVLAMLLLSVTVNVHAAITTRTWQNSGAPWNTGANWGGNVPNSGGNNGERARLPNAASVVNPSLNANITISDLEIHNDQADYNVVKPSSGTRTLTIQPGGANATEGIYLSGGGTSIGTAATTAAGIKIAPKGAQTWDITGTLTLYGTGAGGGNINDNSGEITKTGPGTVMLDNGGAYGGGLARLVVHQGTITGTAASSTQINLFATSGDALTMYGSTEISLIRFAIPAGGQSVRFNGSGSGTARRLGSITLGGPNNGAATTTFNIDDGDADLDMEITGTFGEWGQGSGNQTTVNIVKTGPGTLAIAGGVCDGTTTVNQGTLLVTGTHTVDDSKGSWGGTPTGDYTVASGATLGGGGTIDLSALGGSVTVQAGGNLSPGDTYDPTGTFTLTLGTGTLDVSAIAGTGGLKFDLDTIADSDKVVVGSSLNIGTLDFSDFTFTGLGGFWQGEYLLFQASSIIGNIGSAAGEVGTFDATLIQQGNDILLQVIVPEPSTFLIWALGLIGLAWCARRRRTK